ncbi:thiol-disulfide oxidoreductase DCC family protein [Labilibaculum sp.]|uniref:thiol-disulfide oxidoreductase DCC family protein n=1 Tax=Labilibaculum sp. TaxID=2060723 RepID=UPI003568CF58
MEQYNSSQKYSNPIILFDGVCNLCDKSVQFLLTYNRKENLHFASLQSTFAKNLLQKENVQFQDLSTVIYIENGKAYTKSAAIFEVSKHLIYPWKAIHYFSFIPKRITDWLYELIAKNRYNWFGRKNECILPKSEWQDRFHGQGHKKSQNF